MRTWGRGGAGNIVSDEQIKQQNERVTQDVEANRGPVSSTTAPIATSKPPTHQEYAHMGRGGAGNWYQPQELSKDGSFNEIPDSTAAPASYTKPQISTPWHPEGTELPVARAGRGGAGNFVWKDGEKERERQEEQRRREEEERRRIEGEVEKKVEEGVKMPGKAVLGEGRGW